MASDSRVRTNTINREDLQEANNVVKAIRAWHILIENNKDHLINAINSALRSNQELSISTDISRNLEKMLLLFPRLATHFSVSESTNHENTYTVSELALLILKTLIEGEGFYSYLSIIVSPDNEEKHSEVCDNSMFNLLVSVKAIDDSIEPVVRDHGSHTHTRYTPPSSQGRTDSTPERKR